MKMDIDEDIVKEQLNLRSEEKKVTDLDDIAKAVSQYFKIPLADLKSKARSKEITNVRHIAIFPGKLSKQHSKRLFMGAETIRQ